MHRDVELLAIGAGPSNLALAVALDESAPDELADNSLVIEQEETISWQRGMLLPWAQSQVSFLKDLVTLRNPRSRFTFLNYLHDIGRLDDFINMGSFTPYRLEISDYLQWVASSLRRVRLECSRRCVAIEPRRDGDGVLTGWLIRLADGSTIGSRYLVIGAGRAPHIPDVFADLTPHRIIHSSQYLHRLTELSVELPYRVAVIGGAQSAAEMFHAVQQDLPNCQPTMVMRSIGLAAYETSKFTNELYYPSFVDEFFQAAPSAREQLLREMHRTNYSGLSSSMLETLYRQCYLDKLTGRNRLRMVTMTDVTAAREERDEVVLELTDRKTDTVLDLHCDLVLLGTGFRRRMPGPVRRLAEALGLRRIEVTRHYQLMVDGPATAACYLQGVNEATHGISDSLMSVLAHRGSEIANEIIDHRVQNNATPTPVRAPALS